MKAIWDWLDNKKTVIGGVIVWLVTRTWFMEFAAPPVLEILDYIGQVLLGGGLLHKGVKAMTEKPTE